MTCNPWGKRDWALQCFARAEVAHLGVQRQLTLNSHPAADIEFPSCSSAHVLLQNHKSSQLQAFLKPGKASISAAATNKCHVQYTGMKRWCLNVKVGQALSNSDASDNKLARFLVIL